MKIFSFFLLLFFAASSISAQSINPSKFNQGGKFGGYTYASITALIGVSSGTVLYATDKQALYLYNGDWQPIASNTIASFTAVHNELSGLQGGDTSEYYHLSLASHTLIRKAASGTTGLIDGSDWARFESKPTTASPTFNNSLTVTWLSDSPASFSASVLPAGIAHNDLASKQGGATDEYYHLSAASHSLVTSHPAREDNPHSVTAAQVGNTIPQWNANKIQGTNWGNASPSAAYNLAFYSATETKYLPLRVLGAGSSTVSLSSDSASGTITIYSTNSGGTGSGGGIVNDIYFTSFMLRPNDNVATAVRILNVGDDVPTLNFRKTTVSGPETVWFSPRNVPSNYVTGKKLRIKPAGCTVNAGTNYIKLELKGTSTKSGDAIGGTYSEFTYTHEFEVTASSTNRRVLDTADFDIAASYLEPGAVLSLKITRIAPSGTQSDAQFRLFDVVGEFEE
jgi:hypothetical protein